MSQPSSDSDSHEGDKSLVASDVPCLVCGGSGEIHGNWGFRDCPRCYSWLSVHYIGKPKDYPVRSWTKSEISIEIQGSIEKFDRKTGKWLSPLASIPTAPAYSIAADELEAWEHCIRNERW